MVDVRRPQCVLVDYLGTMTVPMVDAVRGAVNALGYSQEDRDRAVAALAGYLVSGESIIHDAEIGKVPDEDLFDWLEAQAPGASRLLAPEAPSILRAPERPEMRQLLVELQEAGELVFLATNNFASFQDWLATTYLDTGLVNAVVNSALVGARKPEPEFWQLCVDAAEVDNDEIVLLDDQRDNLESAAEFGFQTIEVGLDASAAIDQLWARL